MKKFILVALLAIAMMGAAHAADDFPKCDNSVNLEERRTTIPHPDGDVVFKVMCKNRKEVPGSREKWTFNHDSNFTGGCCCCQCVSSQCPPPKVEKPAEKPKPVVKPKPKPVIRPKPAPIRYADKCIGIPVDVRGLKVVSPLRPMISFFGKVSEDELIDDSCSYAIDGDTGAKHRLSRDCPECYEGASAVLTTLIPSGYGVVFVPRWAAVLVDIEICYEVDLNPEGTHDIALFWGYHNVYERYEFVSTIRAGLNNVPLKHPEKFGDWPAPKELAPTE
jgi:hypothetical protein